MCRFRIMKIDLAGIILKILIIFTIQAVVIIFLKWGSFPSGEPHWERGQDTITGSYPPHAGATGTVVVAYWYQTNFASTVSVKGIAMP